MTLKKQKPFKRIGLKGCTLLSWPCMSCCIGCRCRYRSAKAEPDRQGRSSGSRIILPPDPSRRLYPHSGCVRFRPRLQRRDRSRITRDFLLSTPAPCWPLPMGTPPACQDGFGVADSRPRSNRFLKSRCNYAIGYHFRCSRRVAGAFGPQPCAAAADTNPAADI